MPQFGVSLTVINYAPRVIKYAPRVINYQLYIHLLQSSHDSMFIVQATEDINSILQKH